MTHFFPCHNSIFYPPAFAAAKQDFYTCKLSYSKTPPKLQKSQKNKNYNNSDSQIKPVLIQNKEIASTCIQAPSWTGSDAHGIFYSIPIALFIFKVPVLDGSNRLVSEVQKLLGTTSSFRVEFQLLEESGVFFLFVSRLLSPSIAPSLCPPSSVLPPAFVSVGLLNRSQ